MAEGTGYIVAAYVVTWVTLVSYAARVHAVSRRARARYEDVQTPGGDSE